MCVYDAADSIWFFEKGLEIDVNFKKAMWKYIFFLQCASVVASFIVIALNFQTG